MAFKRSVFYRGFGLREADGVSGFSDKLLLEDCWVGVSEASHTKRFGISQALTPSPDGAAHPRITPGVVDAGFYISEGTRGERCWGKMVSDQM